MTTKNKKLLIVSLIILIGFGLRVYQLGSDSFWNDEAGQALAAIQPTIRELLGITRSHVMAMPLDYLISRLVSRVGLQETIMRFPALIYGVLTLALCFSFVKSVSKFEVAVMATWLFSLHAPHIRYSQEMRFYSALGLFYMLSNILLFKTLRHSSRNNWGLFILATAVGAYFHPYVLLVVINGLIYLFLANGFSKRLIRELVKLSASGLILGLIFLPGYIYFGPGQGFNYDLLLFTKSLFRGVITGLGWLAFPYTDTTPAFGVWELIKLIFTVVGFVILVTRHQNHKCLISVVIGACIQIAMIILADWTKGYWFAPRQIVHLAPTGLILTGFGIIGVQEYMPRVLRKSILSKQSLVSICIAVWLAVTGLVASARISDYYRFPKSNGEQITIELQRIYQDNSPIYVTPSYEEKVYRFYLLTGGSLRNTGIVQAIHPINWEDLQHVLMEGQEDMYLILPAITDAQQEHLEILKRLGAEIVVEPEVNWYYARFLLVLREQGRTSHH